jgi:UDP-glucose 6-dehydrogenase
MNLYEDDVRNEVDCEFQESINDDVNQEQPEISMKELLECMQKLKNGKAPIDGVTSEMIKYASPMWLSYLCQLFNVCMKCAVV